LTPAHARSLSWSELYSRAFQVCADLWPLWVARFLYLIINYGAFLLCLLCTFWPLVSEVMGSIRGNRSLSPADSQALLLDFFSRFKDLGFLGAVAVIFLFYLLWWMVLSAWFNGGLYARLRAWVEKGEPFSWKAFVLDGFYHLIPMLLLQVALGLMLFGFLIALLAAGFLGVFLLALVHCPAWLGILLALPLGFGFFLGLVAYGAFVLVCQACLIEEGAVGRTLEKAARICQESGGRILKAITALTLMVWLGVLVVELLFKGLELIPLMGFLFLLVDLGFRLLFYMFADVYFPALAVVCLPSRRR